MPEDAFLYAAPGRVNSAWEEIPDLPDQIWSGLAQLQDGQPAKAVQMLVAESSDVPADQSASRPTVEDLAARWGLLQAETLDDIARYRQLIARVWRRPYLPTLPHEAEWCFSVYRRLPKADGVTFRGELFSMLDEWQVECPALRREHEEYLSALDWAYAEYKNRVEGAVTDERIEAASKTSRRH
jgi:hypothetical protein